MLFLFRADFIIRWQIQGLSFEVLVFVFKMDFILIARWHTIQGLCFEVLLFKVLVLDFTWMDVQ